MRRLPAPLVPVFALLAAAPLAQVPPSPSPPSFDPRSPTYRRQYGAAQPVELSEVAYNPDSYQRRNVVTRGSLELLAGSAWGLGDGGATLLLVPVPELSATGLRNLLGRRVEVTGIVRVLPTHQGTCDQGTRPGSQCEDPDLPAIPDSRVEWPKGSITAVSILDLADYRPADARRGVSTIADVLADPAARAGKSVRVTGRFRGANLFNDLPAESRRGPGDWVLMDGDHALWVTGRPPRGKGFDLDPGRKSDTGRWLEVEGKIEAMGSVAYLKASRVQLVARPAPPAEKP